MAIIRDEAHESEYLKVHNSTINSYGSLSIEAMGALMYWLAKPPGWQPSVSELAKTWGFGREKAQRIMRELKEAGYVKKSQARSMKGQFVTTELHVYETPRKDSEVAEVTLPDNVVGLPISGETRKSENPSTGNPSTVKPSTEKQATINNVSIEITDSSNNRVKKESSAQKRKRFVPPAEDEVSAYMLKTAKRIELADSWANDFCNYYESNGWKVGRNKMANWKSAATRWAKQNIERQTGGNYGRRQATKYGTLEDTLSIDF